MINYISSFCYLLFFVLLTSDYSIHYFNVYVNRKMHFFSVYFYCIYLNL
nr:MAG TPA: hypothetical protein [Caudoviricetes sp.]